VISSLVVGADERKALEGLAFGAVPLALILGLSLRSERRRIKRAAPLPPAAQGASNSEIRRRSLVRGGVAAVAGALGLLTFEGGGYLAVGLLLSGTTLNLLHLRWLARWEASADGSVFRERTRFPASPKYFVQPNGAMELR
jgi:hypothetical protein